MKTFSEIRNANDEFIVGKKISIESILGKEIIIRQISDKLSSKYGFYIKVSFTESDGVDYYFTTSSKVLMRQFLNHRTDVPFIVTINKIDDCYILF